MFLLFWRSTGLFYILCLFSFLFTLYLIFFCCLFLSLTTLYPVDWTLLLLSGLCSMCWLVKGMFHMCLENIWLSADMAFHLADKAGYWNIFAACLCPAVFLNFHFWKELSPLFCLYILISSKYRCLSSFLTHITTVVLYCDLIWSALFFFSALDMCPFIILFLPVPSFLESLFLWRIIFAFSEFVFILLLFPNLGEPSNWFSLQDTERSLPSFLVFYFSIE